jgi:hypothetical protein
MVKNRCFAIFVFAISLLFLSTVSATAEEYIKNIEVGESDIRIDKSEFPAVAYIYIALKNNGDKKVSNLTFEISYYDDEDYLIKKAVVKNALIEAIPKGETRKYKIRLNGDVVNTEHEQYPYSQHAKVNGFDIKIMSVKLASK